MSRRLLLLAVVTALGRPTGDADQHCVAWADAGECEANPAFMRTNCAVTCARVAQDAEDDSKCAAIIAAAPQGCRSEAVLVECGGPCFKRFQAELTPDKEGNCWYWATDKECVSNAAWMGHACARSCSRLRACGDNPALDACAEPFECPVQRDSHANCPQRAKRGECRASPTESWHASSALRECSLSCHLLDPPATSHTATRPLTRASPRLDLPARRHSPGRCPVGKAALLSALSAVCPNKTPSRLPWARHQPACPRTPQPLTARVPPLSPEEVLQVEADVNRRRALRLAAAATQPAAVEGPRGWALGLAPEPLAEGLADMGHSASHTLPIRTETISVSPRVRMLHNFLSPTEAEHLIQMAEPLYHRSGTARAQGDEQRTSFSASLPSSDTVVHAVRQRIALYSGYPEANLEPLQTVRYRGGEYYRPHHDFYNACETWFNGNRHFTFLIYLNDVATGGETRFPLLNITVPPVAYASLVFNDCLDNGEPDERTLHEGIEPTGGAVKYAINGWMRSRPLSAL